MTGLPAFDPNVLFGATPRNAADDLIKSYLKNAQTQITKQQQAMATGYESEMSGYRDEMLKWTPVTDSINNAKTKVDGAVNKVMTLAKTVTQMISKLEAANLSSTTDWKAVAQQLDILRTTINSTGNGNGSDNLVGSVRRADTYTGNTLTYVSGPNGQQTTIQGSYLGTDYDIRLADNTFFRATGMQTIQQYQAYPQGKIGYSQSVASGNVSLDAPFDDNNLSFTVGTNTAAPTSYTGTTVERHGLGILQSWLYDGLTTAAGRQRAMEDFKAAQDKLNIQYVNLATQQTFIQLQAKTAQDTVNTAQAKIQEVQARSQTELQTYVSNAQRQAQFNAESAAAGYNNPVVKLLRTGGKIGALFDLLG